MSLPKEHIAAISSLLFAVSVGCESSEVPQLLPAYAPASETSSGENANSVFHDFGVVRPGERVTHAFPIRNSDIAVRTIGAIQSGCACTATRATSMVIAPGATEWIEVIYRAPKATADDEQSVIVQFGDEELPDVVLKVRARVREALAAVPDSVVLRASSSSRSPEGSLTLRNYTNTLWDSVEVESSAAWLSAELYPLPAPASPSSAHAAQQLWRAVLRAESQSLTAGDHAATLRFFVPGTEYEKRAVVRLDVRPPVATAPTQLFFGECSPGARVSRTIRFVFDQQLAPAAAEFASVENPLEERLALRWKQISATVWALEAELHAGARTEELNTELRFVFADMSIDAITIPVRALVR